MSALEENPVLNKVENLSDFFYYIHNYSKKDIEYQSFLGLLFIIFEKSKPKGEECGSNRGGLRFTEEQFQSLNLFTFWSNNNNWNNAYFYQVLSLDEEMGEIMNKDLFLKVNQSLGEMNVLFKDSINNLRQETEFWEGFFDKINSDCFVQVHSIVLVILRVC